MSIFSVLFNYIKLLKRIREDKRGHFDILHPSALSPRMWRGFDQRRQ